MRPFGIISDTHHHGWSAFATTTAEGVNSRLQMTLDETVRAAFTVAKAGGNTLYHGGDLFHVRGSIAPSVLNPTLDCYRAIIKTGVQIVINAGNHDLEGKEASRIGSAITALEGIGCTVINTPNYHAFERIVVIPWIANIEALKAAIEYVDPADRPYCDLLMHAPIDGVISGLPDHGLTGAYLASLGFRRVFSGHYHHHMEVAPNVFSIGSLTPQTWSDVGRKSGFLIVSDEGVKWHQSRASAFVEIDGSTPVDDVPLIVDGNYVRVKITSSKTSDIEEMRSYLTDCGATGITILQVKDTAPTVRAGGSMLKAGATLEQSIGDFINMKGYGRAADLSRLCADILNSARSVT